MIRNMLFADDTAVETDSQSHLQFFMDRFVNAFFTFGLTISLKKRIFFAQLTTLPNIIINNYELKKVNKSKYLGSKTNSKLFLDRDLSRQNGMAVSIRARFRTHVWKNL